MMLLVNEMFATLQGEAFWTGMPAVFVRLQGCKVGCPWCDTQHTWKTLHSKRITIDQMLAKEADGDTYASMDPDEVVGAVRLMAPGIKLVVITGGEPAAYDLTGLTEQIAAAGMTPQIETSGTHALRIARGKTWVTVSPKIDMPGGFALVAETLRAADEIKHPVGKMDDVTRLEERVLPHLEGLSPIIWLQPLSQSPKATELCVRVASEKGWRVSIQTHKFLGVR